MFRTFFSYPFLTLFLPFSYPFRTIFLPFSSLPVLPVLLCILHTCFCFIFCFWYYIFCLLTFALFFIFCVIYALFFVFGIIYLLCISDLTNFFFRYHIFYFLAYHTVSCSNFSRYRTVFLHRSSTHLCMYIYLCFIFHLLICVSPTDLCFIHLLVFHPHVLVFHPLYAFICISPTNLCFTH